MRRGGWVEYRRCVGERASSSDVRRTSGWMGSYRRNRERFIPSRTRVKLLNLRSSRLSRRGKGVVGSTQPWGREAPKQVREEGAENDSERCIALHIVLSCPPVDKSARLLDGTVTTLSVRLPEGSAHFQVWLKCSCRQPSNSYISMKASESKERAVSSMLRETYPTLISLQRAERATTG